ncbi:MAG TPA: hypothetical protein DCY88_20155 [Cyanobacteria bacterium UBA11372]|nr:hypothetical protein [Cyanobacteria bacterium UBA11372]
MKINSHQARRITGATSIFLMPLLGLMNAPLSPNFSHPLIEGGFISPARAQTAQTTNFNYEPPNRGMPKTTQGTGSRGCTLSQPVTVTLLVPNDHTGQTISNRPTFFWHVSDKTSVPVEFALVEPGVTKPLFVQRMEVQKPGIMQVQLPQDAPELVSGRKYRWSVSLLCNANRPSSNVFVTSWIERVAAKPELTQKLFNAESEQERARIYAASGLWYDALAGISGAYNANPSDRAIFQARLSLLRQVGLNQVVLQEQQNLASN